MKFQEIILALDNFWQSQGCLIYHPYHTEVGAGTMNIATFLRALGPEPWRVCYLEPSIRPADGRYAQNPNRWQHYYQYQVIIKPAPAEIQDIYLDSLRALGLPLEEHDIRFIEDDWESPTLGAWGLGWEVWLDGMEITQFTYFQQMGGVELEVVSAEITYGLERIAMFLQGVANFLQINWYDNITYGDLYYDSEVQFCSYNFQYASIDTLQELFRLYEKEALNLLSLNLLFPAYDYVLKCSHIFNLLDARGAFSISERTQNMLKIRKLAFSVATQYLDLRKQLGYPLLNKFKERIDKNEKEKDRVS